ncbi:hypothetical protein [Streptomyces sp. NPDC087300]|uniref:hypothetical protein n=1 Tax=Streptomyces sp. NPDC087300 TaxID=3365780 RepID=UPI00381DE8AB
MTTLGPRATVNGATPRIEYHQFKLVDLDGTLDVPNNWPQHSRIATAAGHGVLFHTAGNDFHPFVRLEAWPTEPPRQADGLWEVAGEAEFLSDTGTLLLREWDSGPACDPISIGLPGAYRLRAYCRGRAEAKALIGQEMYYEGVEEWLLQVWPLTC